VDIFIQRSGRNGAITDDFHLLEDDACILEYIENRIVKLDPDGDKVPRDKHCARLVSSGFLEAICDYSARIGPDVVMSTTMNVLEHLSESVFLPKTNKAIRERKQEIEASVRNLRFVFGVAHPVIEVIEGMLAKATLVTDSRKLVSCDACGDNLRKEQIHRCLRCGNATYCSKDCQVKDWQELGHKKKCVKADILFASNRNFKVMENLREAGIKIIAQNYHRFCAIASLKGHSVLECVGIVDVGHFATKLDVKTFDEFIHEMPPEKRETFETNCSSGKLSYCIRGVVDATSVHIVGGLPSPGDQDWVGTQRLAELRFPVDFARARSAPEQRDFMINHLSTPRTHPLQNATCTKSHEPNKNFKCNEHWKVQIQSWRLGGTHTTL